MRISLTRSSAPELAVQVTISTRYADLPSAAKPPCGTSLLAQRPNICDTVCDRTLSCDLLRGLGRLPEPGRQPSDYAVKRRGRRTILRQTDLSDAACLPAIFSCTPFAPLSLLLICRPRREVLWPGCGSTRQPRVRSCAVRPFP